MPPEAYETAYRRICPRLLAAGALILLASAFRPTTCWAQTNSWVTSASDKWETAGDWSLGLAPTNTQSIYVTNALSKIVTIDPATVGSFSNTMTVNDLSLWTTDGSIDMLLISNIGTNLPLTVLVSLSVSNGGELVISDSAVVVSGSTNGFLSLGGDVDLENGSLLVSNVAALGPEPGSPGSLSVNGTSTFSGALCVGLDTNALGNILLLGGQLALTNGPTAIGFYGGGQLIIANNSILTSDQPVIVGMGAASQGSVVIDSGSWIAAGDVIVGEYPGATGAVQITSGQFTVPSGFLTLIGSGGSGQQTWSSSTVSIGALEIGANGGSVALATNIGAHVGSQGTLTMVNSAVNVQGPLVIGMGIGATGAVWMTGGQLVATNSSIFVGTWGDGVITISNGNWIGNSMLLGLYFAMNSVTNPVTLTAPPILAQGTLNLDGGSATLYSNMVIGNCPTGGVGVVNVAGGSLYVTNAAHNAFIDVRDGQLILNGGLLQADVLIMTNPCGLLVRGGGTLLVGASVLDTKLSALGDGIPNGWKQQYGIDPLDPKADSQDPDGDGFSNLQEYLLGTDPTNSASSFQITSLVRTGNDVLVSWVSGIGRANALQVTTGAGDGSYATNNFVNLFIVTNAIVTGITNANWATTNYLYIGGPTNYLDVGGATNSPARYYRVRLVP